MTSRVSTAAALVAKLISENTVQIFSKTTCGYCRRAKELFAHEYPTVPVNVLELDRSEDGASVQEALKQKTKVQTVPQIFVHGNFIGG